MVHNVLRVPALLFGYTLIILMIANGINGRTINDIITEIVESELASIKGEVTYIKTKVDTIGGDVDTMKLDISTIKGDVGTISTQTGAIEGLSDKVTSIDGDVNTILTDISSIKTDVGAITTKVTTIETHVKDVNRCPVSTEGYFIAPGTGKSQCLKVVITERNWSGAKTACKQIQHLGKSLELARPYNARELSEYLSERYLGSSFWVGAEGDTDTIEWKTNGRTVLPNSSQISKASPLFEIKPEEDTSNLCFSLRSDSTGAGYDPKKPYLMKDCSEAKNYLCELV